jgi:hypothetical protein
MDSLRIHDKFRICPTLQQGGTQTIQQSIYLTHNNPCGANQLIFQEMGYTGIRYIDLKNYLDETLKSEPMRLLFEELRLKATEYINHPNDNSYYLRYLFALSNWAVAGFDNIPIPPDYFPGYYMKFSVYDASGAAIFDSDFPFIKIVSQQGANISKQQVRLYVPNPFTPQSLADVYKICNNYAVTPWISEDKFNDNQINFYIRYSDFFANQVALPESIMATASLLLDTANTRSFGIPTYGFSDRVDILFNGGMSYNCCQFINIYTTPDKDGNTTLIESVFARITLYEDASIIPVV